MSVCEFIKEEGIKIKRVHVAFAKWDKEKDDFHLIPSPVLTFNRGEFFYLVGVGIKIGFWGVGVGFSFCRKDIEITRK